MSTEILLGQVLENDEKKDKIATVDVGKETLKVGGVGGDGVVGGVGGDGVVGGGECWRRNWRSAFSITGEI